MIDWGRVEELKEEVGPDDFAEVVGLFFDEVSDVLARLDPGEPARLADDLHFLKGSALNIGLSVVSHLCRDAEVSLKSGQGDTVDIAAIRSAFDDSRALLLTRT